MDNVIHTENLTKVYSGAARALDHLNLDVQRGEIFGYLGRTAQAKRRPSACCSTSSVRRPAAPRCWAWTRARDSVAIKQRIGYLPGELNLWDKQTAQQIIHFVGQARGGYDAAYVHRWRSACSST